MRAVVFRLGARRQPFGGNHKPQNCWDNRFAYHSRRTVYVVEMNGKGDPGHEPENPVNDPQEPYRV
jgi:hypothetical protein